MESFDAFMIGVPQEMKDFDSTIRKFNAVGNQQIVNPAKRKRTDDSIISDRYAKSSTQTARSIQAPQFSNIIPKIGSEIRVKKVISRTTEATTVSAKSDFDSMDSDDVILVPDEETPKSSTAQDLKKNYDAARRSTDYIMYLADSRMSSPKNTERRMTITSPIVSILKKQLSKSKTAETNTSKKNALANSDDKMKENLKNGVNEAKIKSTKNYKQNSCNDKETCSDHKVKHVEKLKRTQLSATLPASGNMVTRSRVSLENVAQALNRLKCSQCDYTSERKSSLTRHMLKHSGNAYKCKHCQEQFIQKTNLITHLRRNHTELQSEPAYWEFN